MIVVTIVVVEKIVKVDVVVDMFVLELVTQNAIAAAVMTLTVKTRIVHIIVVQMVLVFAVGVVRVIVRDFVGMTVKISVT